MASKGAILPVRAPPLQLPMWFYRVKFGGGDGTHTVKTGLAWAIDRPAAEAAVCKGVACERQYIDELIGPIDRKNSIMGGVVELMTEYDG